MHMLVMADGADDLPRGVDLERCAFAGDFGVQQLDLMDGLIGLVEAPADHCADAFKVEIFQRVAMGHAGERVVDDVLFGLAERVIDLQQKGRGQLVKQGVRHIDRHAGFARHREGRGF